MNFEYDVDDQGYTKLEFIKDYSSTITLTFGDQGENHVGMQKIGKLAKKGISVERLKEIKKIFEDMGSKCEYVDLNKECEVKGPEAGLLVIRNGLNKILKNINANSGVLFREQSELVWDSKAFMYGRVVDKHARYNLCYADEAQEPDYENKMGRIVAFEDIPATGYIKTVLEKLLGHSLICEGNRYFDLKSCGIGYHGDSERRIVVGCRIGGNMPLHYQWFLNSKPVGKNFRIVFHHGDMYIMSDKAVGFDWKSKSILTLRHAAGCDEFVNIDKLMKKKDTKKKREEKKKKDK